MKVSINKGEIFKLKTKNTEVSTTGVTITNKKELDLLEEQLYDLLNDKARVEYYKNQIENDIFKLPDKQKTLLIINKKKLMENQKIKIEKEINNLKFKLMEIAQK